MDFFFKSSAACVAVLFYVALLIPIQLTPIKINFNSADWKLFQLIVHFKYSAEPCFANVRHNSIKDNELEIKCCSLNNILKQTQSIFF